MQEQLTYRMFEDADLPGLLRLWEEAGWGTLTPEQWREWFVDGPQGPSIVTVGIDGRGEIVAQEMFAPSRAVVGGREVRALRFSAPIVREGLRGGSLRDGAHPVFGLFKAAEAAAVERGFSVVYSIPEHGWLPIFRVATRYGISPFAEAAYSCAALPVEAANAPEVELAARGLVVCSITEFGEEYEQLWREAKESFPIDCGVVRDTAWLSFRNSGRIAVEVRERTSGRLVGYSATKKQTGLLADLLARERGELKNVIAATLRWLNDELSGLARGLTHLKVMRTPTLAPAIDALGFTPIDYQFAFTCKAFDAVFSLEDVAPERWYILPGD
ncbi:MAG TPA: hypothetical protein VFI24_28790 [Pyrinomonadaceae bacterium]|nr:hypothetical protein [Pyrinomonadaceae bacterium]